MVDSLVNKIASIFCARLFIPTGDTSIVGLNTNTIHFHDSVVGRLDDCRCIVEHVGSELPCSITIPEENSNNNQEENFHLVCVEVCGTSFSKSSEHNQPPNMSSMKAESCPRPSSMSPNISCQRSRLPVFSATSLVFSMKSSVLFRASISGPERVECQVPLRSCQSMCRLLSMNLV